MMKIAKQEVYSMKSFCYSLFIYSGWHH